MMLVLYVIGYIGVTFSTPLLHSSESGYAYVDFSGIGKHDSRVKRQATDDSPQCTLEDELSLPISYKSHRKVLKLERNKMLLTEKLKVLAEDNVGFYTIKNSKKTKDRVTGLYTYVEDAMRFGIMVTCMFKNDCSNPKCEIRGDLLSEYELIEIAGSVEEKAKENSKMSDKVPHNIKKLPGFEYDGKEPIEHDTRIPGLDKNGHPDPNLPPLMPNNRRLKKEDILSKTARKKLEREQKKLKKLKQKKRPKREATQSLYDEGENVITLGITHDIHFFNHFKYQGGVEQEDEIAVELMKEYILYICAGIDHRMFNIRKYAPDIKLRVYCDSVIAKYNVSQNDTGLNKWSLHPVNLGGEMPHLDGDAAIDDLSNFVKDNSYLFFGLDHVMAITGQDMVRNIKHPNGSYWETKLKGYTFAMKTGVLCRQPYYAVSIVESPATGFVSRYAAHEIVHNMGVGHDNNASLSCTLTEQYIMVSDTKPATKTYRSNPYKFSQCSVQGIREYLVGLDKLVETSNQTNSSDTVHCLKHDGSIPSFAALEEFRLQGQRYQMVIQCRYLMNDATSIPCMVPRPSYCWGAVYCTWSLDPGYCYAGYAYNGSPCNSTGICYDGDCIDIGNVPTYTTSTLSPTINMTTEDTTRVTQSTTEQTISTKKTPTTETTTKYTTSSVETGTSTKQTTNTRTTHITVQTTTGGNIPSWSEWTLCSSKCNRKRYRFCAQELNCKGRIYQTEDCSGGKCIDGKVKKGK